MAQWRLLLVCVHRNDGLLPDVAAVRGHLPQRSRVRRLGCDGAVLRSVLSQPAGRPVDLPRGLRVRRLRLFEQLRYLSAGVHHGQLRLPRWRHVQRDDGLLPLSS